MRGPEQQDDYRRVAEAIRYLEQRFLEQPTLGDVADHLGLSPFHVQRLFTRWAGVSPKRFLQYLTVEHAKRLLRRSETVLGATYGAGLSGPSRLHDLFVALEAVTPGEFRSGGAGIELRWGVHDSPFGPAFLAETDRGLTSLVFLDSTDAAEALAALRRTWPRASLRHDPATTGRTAERAFGAGRASAHEPPERALRVHVRGTNFQVRVWDALLNIPPASAVTYAQLARMAGSPGAARAAGSAVSRNPVAFLIPCHRVIRGDGDFGEYRWGSERKKALLAWESAQHHALDDEDAA